jgi:UDP-N-acetylmuramoyl-tripeptide--D-alanyl-D-alanine ligase
MIRLRLSELAAAAGCPAPDRDIGVESIVTDSRRVDFGALFAALPGSQVDGHDFAPAAVRLGAVALLVRRRLDLDVPQLVVPDVLQDLGRMAAFMRQKLDPLVVGITGSNGKTTVKEMVTCILNRVGPVLATRGNYNNELGLPLSLFALEPRHRFAVLELGASKAGDIAYLAGIAAPAVINGDEPWTDYWRQVNRAERIITFGAGTACDVRVNVDESEARIETNRGSFGLQLALPGIHNRLNAAAATAIGLSLDVGLDDIRDGLAAVEPVPGRLNLIHAEAGWTVIDDTYNANPASLYSALQVLSEMQGKAWLVLGDMKELGSSSSKMHREVGDAAKAMGVDRLFATGDLALHTVDVFGDGATHFASREELATALRRSLRPGVNVLVKGSRSMGMEAIVEAITQENDMQEAS